VGATLNLGGAGALPAIVGPPFLALLTTFMAALTAYLPIIQPIADPSGTGTSTMLAAITAFVSAMESTLALKAKVL
jgi:hypothetical protein